MTREIPMTKPVFDEEDRRAITAPLDTGWVTQGPKVAEFERLFASFVGSGSAIATTSCTTALHLALVAAGVGPGDEVIAPSFTFVATANAIEYTGARPVFCDIDVETFNIAPSLLEKTVKERSEKGRLKAVMPVSLFGLCADMEAIKDICGKEGLVIIEDAACALGSYLNGGHAGTFGDFGCFSFHPRKAVTTGEGGMIVTDDPNAAALLRRLRDHGAAVSDRERHRKGGALLPEYDILGYNYRMTDIQGALGISQMAKAERILSARMAAADRYHGLMEMDWLRLPCSPSGYIHSYQSYVLLVDKKNFGGSVEEANRFRNQLISRLEDEGIASRQGTCAVHMLGYYRSKYGLSPSDFPCSYEADRLSLALPLYADMTEEDQRRVVSCLHATAEKAL